jgi:hypothetical protein
MRAMTPHIWRLASPLASLVRRLTALLAPAMSLRVSRLGSVVRLARRVIASATEFGDSPHFVAASGALTNCVSTKFVLAHVRGIRSSASVTATAQIAVTVLCSMPCVVYGEFSHAAP